MRQCSTAWSEKLHHNQNITLNLKCILAAGCVVGLVLDLDLQLAEHAIQKMIRTSAVMYSISSGQYAVL